MALEGYPFVTEECLKTGEACRPCLYGLEARCGYLAIGRELAQTRAENIVLQETNSKLIDRLDLTREDIVVDSCLSPGGMRDELLNNSELQEAFHRNSCGLIYVDFRGQKYINDKISRRKGDDFLQSGYVHTAEALTATLRTQPPQSQGTERRRLVDITPDTLCRIGGDEFVALLPHIGPKHLVMLASNLQQHVSVTRALENYDEGKLPLVASVGYAHTGTSVQAAETLVRERRYWEVFRLLCDTADEQHLDIKKQQYTEMWHLAVSTLPEAAQRITQRPRDGRDIFELFMDQLCPDFVANPDRYIMPPLRSNHQDTTMPPPTTRSPS